jgi:hypothetical protein
MTERKRIVASADYSEDYYAWISAQTAHLREGEVSRLDRENIAEELEDLGKSERRALASNLRNLLLHLLKYEFQRRQRSRSWLTSIENARVGIEDVLADSPSLRGAFAKQVATEYPRARKLASVETGLQMKSFPENCPYSLGQLLDSEFLPGSKKRSAT